MSEPAPNASWAIPTSGPAPWTLSVPDVSFADPLVEELELTTAGLEPATLPHRRETVPDSPESNTGTSLAVTRSTRRSIARIGSLRPAISS